MSQYFKRCIAVGLAVIFVLTNIPFPAPSLYAGEVSIPFSLTVPHFQIPPELGTLEEFVLSGASHSWPLVIHIQTAHGVYSAQKKIQALLHHLRKKYGIDLVLVEGAGVKLDPELDRYFPNAEWNRKIADLKAKRSLTTGAGLFLLDAIQDRQKIDAYGIESIEAYRKNRKSFQTVLREREKIAPLLSHFDRELQKVFTAALSRPLRDFLLREAAFEEKGMSVLAWFRGLRAQAVKELGINLNQVGYQREWPNLVRLARLQKIESSLDKEKVEKEKGRFLADVKRNLTPELFEDLKSLLSKPGALPYAHVRFLLERVVDRLPPAFSFDRYPNLKAELQLLVFQNEIQPASFLAELELLTSRIRNHLAKTEKEKRTISLFEDDQFLKRVFAFELTSKDYASPRLKRNLIRPSRLAERAGLRKDSLKPESLDHYFEAALEFYRGVKEREQWMVKNIEARLAERPSRAAVIITGGFHTEGLKEAFREKGFSYALISPKIEEVETREDYFNTFLEKTPPSFSFSEIEDVDALPVPLRDLRRHGGSPRFVLRSEKQAIQEFLRRGPGLDFLPKIMGGRGYLRLDSPRAEVRTAESGKTFFTMERKKELEEGWDRMANEPRKSAAQTIFDLGLGKGQKVWTQHLPNFIPAVIDQFDANQKKGVRTAYFFTGNQGAAKTSNVQTVKRLLFQEERVKKLMTDGRLRDIVEVHGDRLRYEIAPKDFVIDGKKLEKRLKRIREDYSRFKEEYQRATPGADKKLALERLQGVLSDLRRLNTKLRGHGFRPYEADGEPSEDVYSQFDLDTASRFWKSFKDQLRLEELTGTESFLPFYDQNSFGRLRFRLSKEGKLQILFRLEGELLAEVTDKKIDNQFVLTKIEKRGQPAEKTPWKLVFKEGRKLLTPEEVSIKTELSTMDFLVRRISETDGSHPSPRTGFEVRIDGSSHEILILPENKGFLLRYDGMSTFKKVPQGQLADALIRYDFDPRNLFLFDWMVPLVVDLFDGIFIFEADPEVRSYRQVDRYDERKSPPSRPMDLSEYIFHRRGASYDEHLWISSDLDRIQKGRSRSKKPPLWIGTTMSREDLIHELATRLYLAKDPAAQILRDRFYWIAEDFPGDEERFEHEGPAILIQERVNRVSREVILEEIEKPGGMMEEFVRVENDTKGAVVAFVLGKHLFKGREQPDGSIGYDKEDIDFIESEIRTRGDGYVEPFTVIDLEGKKIEVAGKGKIAFGKIIVQEKGISLAERRKQLREIVSERALTGREDARQRYAREIRRLGEEATKNDKNLRARGLLNTKPERNATQKNVTPDGQVVHASFSSLTSASPDRVTALRETLGNYFRGIGLHLISKSDWGPPVPQLRSWEIRRRQRAILLPLILKSKIRELNEFLHRSPDESEVTGWGKIIRWIYFFKERVAYGNSIALEVLDYIYEDFQSPSLLELVGLEGYRATVFSHFKEQYPQLSDPESADFILLDHFFKFLPVYFSASDIFKILILDQPKKEDQIQNLAHQFPGKVKVVSRIKLTEEELRSVLQDEDWDVVFIRLDTKAFKKPEFLKLLYQGKSGGERIRPPFILRGGSDMDIKPEDALAEKVHLVRSHGNQYSVRDLFFYFLRGFLRKTQPQIFESRVTDSLESFLWSSLIGIKPEEYLEADKKSQRGKMTEGQKEFLFSGLDATPKQATLRGLGDLKIGFVDLGVIPTVINRRLLALSKVSGVEIKRTAFSPSLQVPSRDGGKARLKAERLQVKPKSLEQIVQEANVISLHVPEREGEILKTEHLDLLAKRTGPIALINTSRQVAVNLEALKKALRAKPDLFYFADNALLKTLKDGTQVPIQELEELRSEFPDRVFITPHIAASTEAAGEGVQRNTVASLQEMLRIAFGEVEISQAKLDFVSRSEARRAIQKVLEEDVRFRQGQVNAAANDQLKRILKNRIPRAEVRNSEPVKNEFEKALLDVLNAHGRHTGVRSFIESSEVGGLLKFLQRLVTGNLSLPELFPDLRPLGSLVRQLDVAITQGAKPENYRLMEHEILELIKQVVPAAEIPVPISERKFATPIPRPSVKKSRAPSPAPVVKPVPEVAHPYTGFQGQVITSTDKRLNDVLQLIRNNQEIPENMQVLSRQRTTVSGEIRIANVITAGKKKAISYVSSAAYGSTPQVSKYAQPIIQKTGASEYSVGLQVVSELTNEKFIISSYVFARDGKILSGNPEPSNMEVAGKFPQKEIPTPTYVVGKEIIYSLAHGRVPPQLKRITQEGLEKVGWSGLFVDRKVSFWRTNVFITKLDNYEKPILTLDPAPWLLPQGSNAVPPWVATLWTQEEEVVTPQGNKVMRPEIPFNSIVLYSDKNLTTPQGDTIKAGFLRERPIIDGQKRRGSFLSGRTGFDKVKGEIARGERTFHNTFKVLWNIYWLAGGTDRTPHDDALTVRAGYDEYLFWFAGDTIKIHLGSEFVKGETLRSWISLSPIAPDARGVRYQNFKDGKLAAEKYFVLFQNSKFQKPQEINRDLVEEKKIITPQETIAPFEWKSVKDFYPSLSVEERFLMVRERQKLFSKMRELDRQMEAASLLNSSERLSQYEKLLQPYRELERLANDLVAVQVSGDFTGREYLKDRLHFPRTPAPDSSKIHRDPQNQQLFGQLVAQVINGEATQETFEELERSFGFSEVNRQKIFHAVELPVSQHRQEGGKRVYWAKEGINWINLGSYQKSSIVLTAQTEQKADGKIYLRIRLYDPDRMSEPWDSAYYDYGKKRFIHSDQEWKNYFAGERSLGPPQDMTAAHMTETGGRLYLFPPVRFGSDNETAQKFFGYVELGPNFYEEVDHHGFYPFGTKGSGKRFWAKVSEQDRKILVTIYGTPEMNPESQIQVSEWKAGDPGWRQNKENTSGFEPLKDNVVSEMKGYSSESQRRILFQSWLAGKVPDYLELTLPERILARSKVSLPAPLGTLQGSAKMTVSGADLGTPVSLRTVTETIANDPTTAIDVYDQTGNHHSRAFYSEERPEGINAFLESIRRFKNFQRSLKDGQKDIPEPLLYLKTSAKMSPDLELLDRGRGEGKGRGTNVFLNALNDIDQAGFAKTIEWEHVWLEFGVVEEATGIFPAMYLIPLDQKNRKAVFGLRVVDLGAGQFRYDLPKTYHDLSSEVIPRIEERGYFRNLNGIVYPEIIRHRIEFLQNKTSPAAFFEFLNKLVERKVEISPDQPHFKGISYPRVTREKQLTVHYIFGSDASGYVEKTQEVTLHEGKNSIVLEETVADGKRLTQEISIMLDTEAPKIIDIQAPEKTPLQKQESISIPEITKQKEPSIEQELPRAPPEAVQNQVSHSVWPNEFNQLDRILFISIPAIPNYQERLDLLRALRASSEDPDFQKQLKKLKDRFLILQTTYGAVSQNMPSIEPTHVLPEPDLGKLWEDFRISIRSFGQSIRPTPVLIYRPADYPWDQAREGKIFMSELQKQIKAIQTSNLGMTYFWVEMAPAFHDAETQRPLRPAFYVVGLNVEKGTASPVYRFLEKEKNKFVKGELNIFGNDGAFTHPVYESARQFGYGFPGQEVDFASIVSSRLELINQLIAIEEIETWESVQGIDNFIQLGLLQNLRLTRRAQGAGSLPKSERIQGRHSTGFSSFEIPFFLRSHNLSELFWYAHQIVTQETASPEDIGNFLKTIASNKILSFAFGRQTFLLNPFKILWSKVQEGEDITTHQDLVRAFAGQVDQLREAWQIPLVAPAPSKEFEEEPLPIEPAEERASVVTESIPAPQPELEPEPEPVPQPKVLSREEMIALERAQDLEFAETNPHEAFRKAQSYFEEIQVLTAAGKTEEAANLLEHTLDLMLALNDSLSSFNSEEQATYYYLVSQMLQQSDTRLKDVLEFANQAVKALGETSPPALRTKIITWKQNLEVRKGTEEVEHQEQVRRRETIQNLIDQFISAESVREKDSLIAKLAALDDGHFIVRKWRFERSVKRDIQQVSNQIDHDEMPKVETYTKTFSKIKGSIQRYFENFHHDDQVHLELITELNQAESNLIEKILDRQISELEADSNRPGVNQKTHESAWNEIGNLINLIADKRKWLTLEAEQRLAARLLRIEQTINPGKHRSEARERNKKITIEDKELSELPEGTIPDETSMVKGKRGRPSLRRAEVRQTAWRTSAGSSDGGPMARQALWRAEVRRQEKTAEPIVRSSGLMTYSSLSSRERTLTLTQSQAGINHKYGRPSPAGDRPTVAGLPGVEPGSARSRDKRSIRLSYRPAHGNDAQGTIDLKISKEKIDLNEIISRAEVRADQPPAEDSRRETRLDKSGTAKRTTSSTRARRSSTFVRRSLTSVISSRRGSTTSDTVRNPPFNSSIRTAMNRRRPVPLDRPRSIFRLANETLSRILLREDNIQFPVQIPEAIAAPAEGRLGEIRQQTLAKLPAVRIRDFLPGRARTSVGLLVTLDAFKRLGPVLEAMAHDNPDLRVAVIGRGDIEEIAIQRKIVQELDPRFSVAENAETALSHLRMKRVSYIEGVGLDEVTAARLREIAPFKTRPESELQAYGARLGLHSLLEQFSAAFQRALESAA